MYFWLSELLASCLNEDMLVLAIDRIRDHLNVEVIKFEAQLLKPLPRYESLCSAHP